VSTASNVRRFGEGLFGGELLQPETLSLMQTFEDGYGQYNMPELEYGLGIMRHRLPVGPQPDGHGITIALAVNQFSTDLNTLATCAFDAVLTAQDR